MCTDFTRASPIPPISLAGSIHRHGNSPENFILRTDQVPEHTRLLRTAFPTHQGRGGVPHQCLRKVRSVPCCAVMCCNVVCCGVLCCVVVWLFVVWCGVLRFLFVVCCGCCLVLCGVLWCIVVVLWCNIAW